MNEESPTNVIIDAPVYALQDKTSLHVLKVHNCIIEIAYNSVRMIMELLMTLLARYVQNPVRCGTSGVMGVDHTAKWYKM